MNYVHAIAGITPAVAPVIGSYLGVIIGWRNCFVIVFVMTAFLAAFMYIFQAETLERKKTTNLKTFLKDYRSIFLNHHFISYATVKVLTVMMFYCEIANIPLIFINYSNVPPMYYGLYVFPVFICYMGSALYSSYLIKSKSVDTVLKMGLILLFSSNALLLILSLIGFELSPFAIQCIKIFSYSGWGFIFGNATAEIVSAIPGKAGMASAVMIALEMLCSSTGIYLLGFFFNGTIVPLTIFLLIFTVVASSPYLLKNKVDVFKGM